MNENNNNNLSENIILVENLVKTYKGGTKAVDGVSFGVKKGSIFAFLGPNGAGKTTTIKILTTLLKPTSGVLSVAGFNPVKEKDAVRHSFGIVFQDPSLDEELTAYENMDFHGVIYKVEKKLRKLRIEELLKFVDLWDRRDELAKKFSGGMKRRLEIARGLLHHPKIFFLDEPTIGLDPQTRNHMWNYLKDLNKKEGITIFFSTHYIEEAEKMADSVAVIDNGKIIATGTPSSLMTETKTDSLESAFLSLTGKSIREESVSISSQMKHFMRR